MRGGNPEIPSGLSDEEIDRLYRNDIGGDNDIEYKTTAQLKSDQIVRINENEFQKDKDKKDKDKKVESNFSQSYSKYKPSGRVETKSKKQSIFNRLRRSGWLGGKSYRTKNKRRRNTRRKRNFKLF